MRSASGDAVAGYPMVEEADATGVVAAVYARLLEDTPFVPSLFKSLALCPGYLVLAHEQAAPVRSDRTFGSLASELAASVRSAATPPADEQVREALAQFVGPLSRMLLLAAGLRLALDDVLDAPPAGGPVLEPRPVEPRAPAPSTWDAPTPGLFGEIRAALDTPLINSVWRVLAGRGLLEPAWTALRPQTGATRAAADDLRLRALEAARRVPWQSAASPAALQAAGLGDAAPGMASVLDCYLATLPRVLVLVASSSTPG